MYMCAWYMYIRGHIPPIAVAATYIAVAATYTVCHRIHCSMATLLILEGCWADHH